MKKVNSTKTIAPILEVGDFVSYKDGYEKYGRIIKIEQDGYVLIKCDEDDQERSEPSNRVWKA